MFLVARCPGNGETTIVARGDVKEARRVIEVLPTKERHPCVVRKAAEALGQIGSQESIGVLTMRLRSELIPTRWAAKAAIEEIRERYVM